MKEAQIFENWINNLSEGTWALPETPEQMEKLNELMSGELIVGPDATNATEQLYDIVGDDELFDILNDLADRSEGRANCWDDSDVQRRLAELGIQTPQSTETAPADVPQDTAPPVAEGELDEQVMGGQMNMFKTFSNNVANGQDAKQAALAVAKDYGMKPEQVMFDLASFGKQSPQWIDTPELQNAVKTLQQLAAANRAFDPQIEESNELAEGEISMSNPGKLSNDEYKDSLNRRYGQPDLNTSRMNKQHQDFYDKNPSFKQSGKQIVSPGDGRLASKAVPAVTDTKVERIPMNTFGAKQGSNIPKSIQKGGGGRAGGGGGFGGVKPGQSPSLDNPIQNENAELARMLEHAGVPLQEGVLTDSTGSTLEHIKDRFGPEVRKFTQSGDMDNDLYDALYDYYFDDMPYGTKKARDGDPHEWVSNRFADDLGINENLIAPIIMPVSEGSCNMTMEGQYCPEHGLMECGGMYEDGGAVGMPYSMGEGVDDPINSNSAMTGSYYEGKETDIQEGDALLARIKSLALLR